MIPRAITDKVRYFASKYPVVTLTGPRQSGKSTLLKNAFPDYQYLSLEDPDILLRAKEDPRLFLRQYPNRIIIDEAQRFPQLFSFMQTHVDNEGKEGMYLLSGSQNFLLRENISQTLAGRTAILKLLPFSFSELEQHGFEFPQFESIVFKGGYPRIYQKNLEPHEFYPFYSQTYIERDVRQVQNVSNLDLFVRFVKLCAGRVGQLLNISALANDCGITQPTAKAWLSVLEASYIIFFLRPFHKNYSKRLVKSPKLYFIDTGLACSLLGISTESQLSNHFLRGGLFENWVILEMVKKSFASGQEPSLYFWRDNTGNEIDLLIEKSGALTVIEVKAGSTYTQGFLKNLNFWKKIQVDEGSNLAIVYGGDKTIETPHARLISWKDWAR
ncbi:MAG TPA: ATP-binding protein [Bacteroidales bacterium]|nr:ATP-binding protein [Bacteroidales bacterium]